MQAYWNKLVLDRPPTTSWRCSSNQFDSRRFLKAVNRAILELESQKLLETEAAILSRLIYRMKSKLRSDKGLKNMEKINRALLNYLKLSLENDYKYLRDNTEFEGDNQALPSRQMLQYTLVRTQGFAKLMCRIEDVAKCAGEFFKARISVGQAWSMSLVAYAVISRIWVLSRYLTKKCCDWYNRLYKYLNKLTMVGVPWLPENYMFPEDLKTWLSVPWIDEEFKSFSEIQGVTGSIFSLITQNEEPEEDLEIDLDETNVAPVVKSERIDNKDILQTKLDRPTVSQMEIGERISRDVFAARLAKQTTEIPVCKKVSQTKAAPPPMEIGERISRDVFAARSAKQTTEIPVCKIVSQTKAAPPPMEIGERISREAFFADSARQTTEVPRTKKRKNVVSSDTEETVAIPSKRNPKDSVRNETAKKVVDKKTKKSKVLSVDDLETKEDVVNFLSLESYPGLDKMQWKIIRKSVSKLLARLDKHNCGSGTKKQDIVLKKIIRSLREWMH